MGRILIFVTILFPTLSFAVELPKFTGVIAPAVLHEDLPYQQIETETQASLLILGRLGSVFIEGNRAGLPLKRFAWGSLSLMGQLRTHQYLDASETTLTDQDRKRAIELGPQASILLGSGYVAQVSLLQDVSQRHEAQELEVAVYKRFSVLGGLWVTTLAGQYQSQDLMQYYVGTEQYKPDAEWTYEAELLGRYDLNPNWKLIVVYRHYQHGSDFNNSPLTSGDTTKRFALGVGYQF
ncbi:MipA/OmpV family protein [Bermanella marisrubri]|uniref:Outer membrane protein V n=1 Tax=Bermanella marisrubri TaxID=207949 RepID=Q1N214_9GAMM|nr:MipA/OmpV family protein [Bermanella marisrubri]EAT12350.1 outer membrane protein V [Bermanella marisrubri]QIZ85433.1 MipA/OmpV family protein [Bermanella marisrubri]